MVDFAGWEMPILYRGIIDEHEQTRKSGSIFDVSHMGGCNSRARMRMKFLNRSDAKIADRRSARAAIRWSATNPAA